MTQSDDARQHLIRSELLRVDGSDPGAAEAPSKKHSKMTENPFRFLRGSAQLFYADIQQGQLELPAALSESPPLTTVMGDCHVANFGFLTEQGSHGDQVVFCPNDYDDACVGPAVWDIARYLVSLALTAEYCRGLVDGRYQSDEVDDPAELEAPSASDAEEAGHAFLDAYRRTCRHCVRDPGLRFEALDAFPKKHVLGKAFRKACRRAAGGKDFETKSTLAKEVRIDAGRLVFRDRPGRFARLDTERAEAVREAFRPYVDDAILDLVRRLGAGTGSVDLERFYLLVGPEEFAGGKDLALCHVVEVKQQRPASPLYWFPDISPVNRLQSAHLTIDCQRLMQRAPDLVLDEAIWEDTPWLVRSRHHARVGIDPEEIALAPKKPGKQLKAYAQACGQALALAHARGDRRSTRFEASMAKQLPDTSKALVTACAQYAEQVVADQRRLRAILRRLDAAASPAAGTSRQTPSA
ncbi:MAG: DUF2252 domain-containing protein [Gammaproteobacteria bacterium]|jgi:uncharacterized protein (DUF2252 family)|nr:DUF2252 domain-containing protein [Gammaproteobacteria bacterium]